MTMPSDEVFLTDSGYVYYTEMQRKFDAKEPTVKYVRADIHEALVKERDKYKRALRNIAVYDLYDCSAVEDTDWQEQCKMMYEIAQQALKGGE